MIDKFVGDFKKFSNFEPVIIFWKGLKFPSVEHAYASSKSPNPKFWLEISMLPAKKANVARKRGRNTRLRPNWKELRVDFMEKFLRQKFEYDRFKELLLSTHDEELLEGNFWHDNFWGDCECDGCSEKEGQNMLGKLLMKLRSEIQ
jgi:ribA/ribD-fused uncharacterized protein